MAIVYGFLLANLLHISPSDVLNSNASSLACRYLRCIRLRLECRPQTVGRSGRRLKLHKTRAQLAEEAQGGPPATSGGGSTDGSSGVGFVPPKEEVSSVDLSLDSNNSDGSSKNKRKKR